MGRGTKQAHWGETVRDPGHAQRPNNIADRQSANAVHHEVKWAGQRGHAPLPDTTPDRGLLQSTAKGLQDAQGRLLKTPGIGIFVQCIPMAALVLRPALSTVVVILLFFAYVSYPGRLSRRRRVCVHGGGIPLLEGAMVSIMYERRPTIFLPLPPGIAAMWDGPVGEQIKSRRQKGAQYKFDEIKLGRCRILCTDEGEWRVQASENKHANARDPLASPNWTTWYTCMSAVAMGAELGVEQEPVEHGAGAEPPYTTGKHGARWHRAQPGSRYVGNRVPLFLGHQEEVGQGGAKSGSTLPNKKLGKGQKTSKDAGWAHKSFAFLNGLSKVNPKTGRELTGPLPVPTHVALK